MNKKEQARREVNRGFTLIEILVVIGIIAVLAAVVLIAINPARQFAQANNSQRTANTNAILNAIGQYMADNQGALPAAIAVIDAEVDATDICDDLVTDYMPALPVDPTVDEGPVENTDCGDYDTEYDVVQQASGRVSVCAPLAADEAALGVDAAEICVTR